MVEKSSDDGTGEKWWMPKLDWDGSEMVEQYKPFTITGLALALGTTRQTLLEYEGEVEGREKADPRFADAVKMAKLKCENYAEEQVFNGKNAAGPIFVLKNYRWTDKTEIDHTTGGERINGITYVKPEKPDEE